MLRSTLLIVTLAVCGGCTSLKTDDQVTSRFDPDRIAVDMDRDKMTRSVQTPLYMLNIKQDEIPELLPEADGTYSEPENCLNAQVQYERLNMLLGSDDALKKVADYESINLDASDAIESTISDFIPFESVIKYVSGATKHEKQLERAYFRGNIRRAYLKGYIDRNNCEIPLPPIKPGTMTAEAARMLAEDEFAILVGPSAQEIPADAPVAPVGHEVDRDGYYRPESHVRTSEPADDLQLSVRD